MKNFYILFLFFIVSSLFFTTFISGGTEIILNSDKSYTYHVGNNSGIKVFGAVNLSWNRIDSPVCYNLYAVGRLDGNNNIGEEDFAKNDTIYTNCEFGEVNNLVNFSLGELDPTIKWYFMVFAIGERKTEIANSNIIKVTFNDWCTDSDGGKNYSETGYTKGSFENKFYNDVCADDYKSVFEYFCMYDAESSEHYKVSSEKSECPNGDYCSNGACVSVNLTDNKCVDTDGWNEGRKGLRITNLDGNISIKEDYCILGDRAYKFPEQAVKDDPNKKVENCTGKKCYLIEYQCNSENLSDEYTVFWCGNDCINGACVVYAFSDQGLFIKIINWLRDLFGI